MANSIGNGGFNIPNYSTKVGFQKPAASVPQEQAQQLPGDVSDINFSFSAPAAAKAETFVQSKAVPTESAPVTSFNTPSRVSTHSSIMDLSVGEVGMNLLGPSSAAGATQGVEGILSASKGYFEGLGGGQFR